MTEEERILQIMEDEKPPKLFCAIAGAFVLLAISAIALFTAWGCALLGVTLFNLITK